MPKFMSWLKYFGQKHDQKSIKKLYPVFLGLQTCAAPVNYILSNKSMRSLVILDYAAHGKVMTDSLLVAMVNCWSFESNKVPFYCYLD